LWLVSWFLLVTAVSFAPLPLKHLMHTRGAWHDYGHMFVFFTTGTLVLSRSRRLSRRALAVFLVFTFCIAIEQIQATLGHNHFEWRDLRTDVVGIFSACVVMALFQIFSSCRKSKPESMPLGVHRLGSSN
jgi:VanZ family protein